MKDLKNREASSIEIATTEAFLTSDFPLDPVLPKNFDSTPNEERKEWVKTVVFGRPYIETVVNKNWKNGKFFNVRCLDGRAWDRSTNHGAYDTLEEAIAKCTSLI